SRRRHTSSYGDWSSDVCSSDLMLDDFPARSMAYELSGYRQAREEYDKFHARYGRHPKGQAHFLTLREWLPTIEKYLAITTEQKANPTLIPRWYAPYRSEERRVGKECRSRWARDVEKKQERSI